ncbi:MULTISPECIES: FGGY-family carbohydrate kinase [unclassified Ruegeria]|uniref:FGGY-family carbohydrate kinase n=1 Tax=unclassified Ruegeria TaxID=2625375 RepID=UPI001489F94B|nr:MULTISPECIES: FGGY-family carbohydrate kinase [unclassified Ruegeria]NOD64816.1 ribulokinase [Ruegeria sp. HKCCD6109]
MRFFLGVDVGTGSARAGIFDSEGHLQGCGVCELALFQEGADIVEQSSTQAWSAVCKAVQAAVGQSNVDLKDVAGIGFDATCSLVVVGKNGAPLPVGSSGDAARDIIVWMDHRAMAEADEINATKHAVLAYVGGAVSPEMQLPKLLWLKRHMPETFTAAEHFFDLTDFLTWKATGFTARSSCTVTCKWTYVARSGGWDESFFKQTGLGELAEEGFRRIGNEIVDPGQPLANGLTADAAKSLGLVAGTPVAAGLIDAHAGGVGTVGAKGLGPAIENMAYVFGTSSCTMTTTANPTFVPGVWGPYYSAMLPGMWLNEGGQSAAGVGIERLIAMHPAVQQAADHAKNADLSVPNWLMTKATEMVDSSGHLVDLARDLHVVPEFLGNRAPFADPRTRAVIAGLDMDTSLDSLVSLYIAGLCGLGYGLRQIIETQAEHNAKISNIVVSGGASRQEPVRQLLADTTGISISGPETEEPVLLGAAILGACAAGQHGASLSKCMSEMSRVSDVYRPSGGRISDLHQRRFQTYQAFQTVAREAAALM